MLWEPPVPPYLSFGLQVGAEGEILKLLSIFFVFYLWFYFTRRPSYRPRCRERREWKRWTLQFLVSVSSSSQSRPLAPCWKNGGAEHCGFFHCSLNALHLRRSLLHSKVVPVFIFFFLLLIIVNITSTITITITIMAGSSSPRSCQSSGIYSPTSMASLSPVWPLESSDR